jgi:hypothetical protein
MSPFFLVNLQGNPIYRNKARQLGFLPFGLLGDPYRFLSSPGQNCSRAPAPHLWLWRLFVLDFAATKSDKDVSDESFGDKV